MTAAPPARALEWVERHRRPLLSGALAAACLHAWLRRFVTDDAFISFRYARHLAEGEGLVFNLGERVEGYTNFLWTLLLAAPHAAGVDPILFCELAGPIAAALAVYFTWRAGLRLVGSAPGALLAAALLAASPSFAAWCTGGLETPLLICLQAAILWLGLEALAPERIAPARCTVISAVAAAAVMTRLDAVLFSGAVVAALTFSLVTRGRGARETLSGLAALWLPALLIVGGWLAWKLAYYGSLLPNTFHAKVGAAGSWARGLDYLRAFLDSYYLWPVAALIAVASPSLVARRGLAGALPLAMLGAQGLYGAAVGGDFMEFRLMAPVLPILFLLTAWVAARWIAPRWLGILLVLIVAAGAWRHARGFAYTGGIESIEGLIAHLHDPAGDWVGVGRTLERDLRGAPDLWIAVTAAGAIPYYSDLPTLDMLGLSDRWVARHGIEIDAQPGHHRLAPFSYLVARGVNLVLGHPLIAPPSPLTRERYAYEELSRLRYVADTTPPVLPPGAGVVEVPLDARRVLVALYLTPHPVVEALIASGRWRRLGVTKPAGATP